MDEAAVARALAGLEALRGAGRLTPADYAERRQAFEAVLPGGDARRSRLSARPLWWFAAAEATCKAGIVACALLVG